MYLDKRIAFLLVAAALTACEGAPAPAAPAAVEPHHAVASFCNIVGQEGCYSETHVIDIGAIDIGDSYIEGTDDRRYYVSVVTQFLPVALPPSPIMPTDLLYGTVTSWNALVDSQGSYRAFLGQLRQLPPSPIVPPNPIRFRATGLTIDGSQYLLESLQPVITN